MSTLLALETSTKFLSVALFRDRSLLEEINKPPNGRSHSEMLLPLIDSLLKKFHVTLSHEVKIAFAAGPGSYTSLRVGLSTVLGLARGGGCQLIPVSSLKALAYQRRDQHSLVAPLLKGGRGRVYGALYEDPGGKFNPIIKEGSYEPEEFLSKIPSGLGTIDFIGPGSELVAVSINPTINPNASSLGALCLERSLPVVDWKLIQLDYLQEPDFG